MYVILSDGVGTGKEAEKISKSTIRVPELFPPEPVFLPEMSLPYPVRRHDTQK